MQHVKNIFSLCVTNALKTNVLFFFFLLILVYEKTNNLKKHAIGHIYIYI